MTFLTKALWYLSVLGFLIVLFGTFRNLTPEVTVAFDTENTMGNSIGRDYYFFGCIAVFMVFSILINIIINLVKVTPKNLIFAPNKEYWFSTIETRITFREIYERWFYGLMAVLNLFLMYIMLLVEKENYQDGIVPHNYSTFYIIILVLAIFTIISLPIRLMVKNHDLLARS